MKGSLKLMLGIVLACLFSGAQAMGHLLHENRYVFAYVPGDLEDDRSGGKLASYLCDEYENEIHTDKNKKAGTVNNPRRENNRDQACGRYHSKSTRTSWVMTFISNPGTPARVNKIFKVENNERMLWVKFDPKRNNIATYVSAGAQKSSGMKKADNNTDAAKKGDEISPGGDIVKDAQNGDAEDLIKKGIGIVKGLKF